MSDISSQNIMYLPGVGPRKAEVLKKEIEVVSWEDLIYYFPYKYVDRSRVFKIAEIDGNMPYIQLKGRIQGYEVLGEGRAKRIRARFYDDSGSIELVWFKAIKSIPNQYKIGQEYILFGKPSLFAGKINVAHPELELEAGFFNGEVGVQGQYNTSERMKDAFLHSRAIQKMIKTIFGNFQGKLSESLNIEIIEKAHVIDLDTALRNIHFPQSPMLLRNAQFRLKFEELFYLQLNILRVAKYRNQRLGGFIFDKVGDYFNNFYSQNLPFELTGAQKRVVKEIRQDMNTGRQMNRLLQGDVGSGKTLVALMSMLIAMDNGFQVALMAPTEILAKQHYETIMQFVQGLGIEVQLLTGSVKKKVRSQLLPSLQEGTIQMLIGTHALIEDSVVFNNLGLVVIDEQHRFGVAQRARLWKKNNLPPHILVMTATPIPRTLAMTLYGDLDVSVIDELPPGRKPIKTKHVYSAKRNNLYDSVRKQVQEGRQVYIVYPLIDESATMDYKNLTAGFEQTKEIFPEYEVCMVHGKMKPAEKEAEMQKFVAHQAHIMLATTVIEVGVNVPNASVMIIESAERFGLSQLHQLRGRVGRGADQSFCILLTAYELSENTRKRIAIMCETNDGFLIAEEDLKLRGPGDIDGTQQSGVAFDLKIANLAKDGQIVSLARELALEVLEEDSNLAMPKNYILNNQLIKKNRNKQMGWFMIS
ncbi:ATP-dependent DNA helicase [Bacteroidales bacterium]|nr:ATP-dependent DNA helicase [Bacteroidales bacterium]